jgi:hypothetical protein
MWLFQKESKKVVFENENKLVYEYVSKISSGKILSNDEIENILLMKIDNIRKILEYYNKSVYHFREYILLIDLPH